MLGEGEYLSMRVARAFADELARREGLPSVRVLGVNAREVILDADSWYSPGYYPWEEVMSLLVRGECPKRR